MYQPMFKRESQTKLPVVKSVLLATVAFILAGCATEQKVKVVVGCPDPDSVIVSKEFRN